jgi:lipoate---protein ligase
MRFIQTDYTYADFSTGISPAIELAMERGQAENTVLLNIFGSDSFTVGFFDDPVKSMDLEYCRQHQIVVRRRQNAGGAVLGAQGCAFLVFYLDIGDPIVPMKTIAEAFSKTLTGLAEVLNSLFGIGAVYRPLNDVEVNGKKIVASSARLAGHALTVRLLINVVPTDRNVLNRAIKIAPEKIQDKQIKEVGQRFTCLEEETGSPVAGKDLVVIAQKTCETCFGRSLRMVPGDISPIEKAYAQDFQDKYTSSEWFYANSEQFRFKDAPADVVKTEGRHKAMAGLIRATLLLKPDILYDLIITGDFHPTPNDVLIKMETALRGKPRDLNLIAQEIRNVFHTPGVEIAGTSPKDFIAAFSKAL